MKRAFIDTLRQFLKSTTLHGFKYLASPYNIDRVCWVLWCCAGACCAGALCAVLWQRFLQVPALLTLRDLRAAAHLANHMPVVGICLSSQTMAQIVADQLTGNITGILPVTSDKKLVYKLIRRLLERQPASKGHLLLLESLLYSRNMTISEALLAYMPPCIRLLQGCRFQGKSIPCDQLFSKELVRWAGVCCVMRDIDLTTSDKQISSLSLAKNLDVVLQSVNGSDYYEYEFFTKFHGEDESMPLTITRGYYHMAELTFISVQDREFEKIVDGTCISDPLYTRTLCQVHCNERACGCSDPLRTHNPTEKNILPVCSVTQMNCLGPQKPVRDLCHCKSACKFVTSQMTMWTLALNAVSNSFDPLMEAVNNTGSAVLSLRVMVDGSKVFDRMSTETWISLLSSLGGVFNMFLGVGLFSGLEVIYFFIFRFPLSIRRSAELNTNK